MNESKNVTTILNNLSGNLEEAAAINKAVILMIAAKSTGQDIVIGDDEALGFMLILEQLGSKLEEAVINLEKEVV
jgi:hypothetical protein